MHRFLTCILVGLIAMAGHAQDESFWAFLKEGHLVTRCAAASPSYEQARRTLTTLDERIRALRPADPVGGAVSELHALMKAECFLPAAETDRIPRPDTALSLKEWWIEQGGWNWLESLLEPPMLGTLPDLAPHTLVPPDARETLNLEAHGDHPLRPLLCPLTDRRCGAETRGWRLRADAFFEAQRTAGVPDEDQSFQHLRLEPDAVARQCETKVSSSPADLRYQNWRACLEAARPKQFALPLGEFQRPTSGWFVVGGRRGHYEFCDTTRAYDLTTGAAFMHDSCSGLAILRDGSVDFGETDQNRRLTVRAGVVPVENLREAVWMTLLRGEATELQMTAAYYPLPAGMTPQFRVGAQAERVSLGGWFNTAQTTLAWRWRSKPGVGYTGEVTWPNSSDAAESHAASLLDVAERGFIERCPPARPPALAVLRSGNPRVLNDADAELIVDLDDGYAVALNTWRKIPPCK